jgi:hypothetical protein
VTDTAARLNGNITVTGGEDPHVTVYWGDNDGAQTPGNWDNNSDPTSPAQHQGVAAFYKDVTGLTPNVTYYFSASANNSAGTSWPAASLNFTTTYTLDVSVKASIFLLPDGAGDYTGIATQFPNSTSHYDKVDDPVATPDDDTTYLTTNNAAQEKDAYTLQDTSVGAGTITAVIVHFRFKASIGGFPSYEQPFLRLGVNETAGTEVSDATGSYYNFSETLARPGGGSYSWSDINSLQVCIGLKKHATPATGPYCTQVYIEVQFVDYNFGTLQANATSSTGLTLFTVTNNSNVVANITIHGHDMTGAGKTWTLSDTGAGGVGIIGMNAGLSGGSYNIVVRKNTSYNELKHALAVSGTQQFGLQLVAPTSNVGNVAMSGTVTLTVSLHT